MKESFEEYEKENKEKIENLEQKLAKQNEMVEDLR